MVMGDGLSDDVGELRGSGDPRRGRLWHHGMSPDLRWVLLLSLAAALPLLPWPIPPLIDVPGHIGRFTVQTSLAESPLLQQWYSFRWALAGNLGVDLLVEALEPLLGVERSTWLIVATIPPLQVAGFLLVARETHGRIPPTAFFALPLAYNHQFHFGFVNYALSSALAFLLFALWLRLGRAGRLRLRAGLFAPLCIALWITHISGWAILCVMIGFSELVRVLRAGGHRPTELARSALSLIALLAPIPASLLLGPGGYGGTGLFLEFERLEEKLMMYVFVVRDRWAVWDIAALVTFASVIVWGLVDRRVRVDRALLLAGLTFGLLTFALPDMLLGSHQADSRLAWLTYALPLLALDPRPDAKRLDRVLLVAGLGFAVARFAGNAASLCLYDRSYRAELTAIDNLPRGAVMALFAVEPCVLRQPWAWDRLRHLSGLAIGRREAFSNDQWQHPGAHLLSIHLPGAGAIASDSTIAVDEPCPTIQPQLSTQAANLPPVFDHLWVIGHRPGYHPAGWRPVWTNARSTLFERQP
jgi:hypothetical protein